MFSLFSNPALPMEQLVLGLVGEAMSDFSMVLVLFINTVRMEKADSPMGDSKLSYPGFTNFSVPVSTRA